MSLYRAWPILLGLIACGWALLYFDWHMVGATLVGFDIIGFLKVGIPVTLGVFMARSLRWVAVSGMAFTPVVLWRTHLQTALAIATAAVTPLQAGEALKIKFARDSGGASWASLLAAFALERLADIAVLLGLGALAFGMNGVSGRWLILAALGLALLIALAPFGLRRLAGMSMPIRIRAALLPLKDYNPSAVRMLILGLCTVAKWFGVLLLWQATFAAAGISLSLAECALAMVLVTISVTVSLVPGGIGVAEISARAVLLWLGVEPGHADAGAVMLRLLTLLLVALGLLHGLGLIPLRKVGPYG